MDTTEWIQGGGLFLICLLVFGSTGLFFCFFLPVGAVMFTAGVFIASGSLGHSFQAVCLLLSVSALAGNCGGYLIGRWIGPLLRNKPDTWYFKQQHLRAAEKFYGRYGGWAISCGFFLPIIRTFSPVVTGLVRVSFIKLMGFSIIGALLWVCSFVGAGFFIGSRPLLRPYLGWVVGGFIAMVTIPLLVRIVRALRKGHP